MWCAVWFSSPHVQEAVSLSSHWHMLEPKRPTPVVSLFKVIQRLRGRLEPGERPMFGLKQNWEGGVMSFHEFVYAHFISNPEAISFGGGKRASTSDAVRWRLWRSGIEPQRGCLFLNAAWHPSLHVSCSLRRFGGAMPARISNSPVGVGRKHPVIRRSVSFSATSRFLLWQQRHQTGAAYTAALKTIAKADVQMVGVLAPHDEPARQRRRLLRAQEKTVGETVIYMYIRSITYQRFIKNKTKVKQTSLVLFYLLVFDHITFIWSPVLRTCLKMLMHSLNFLTIARCRVWENEAYCFTWQMLQLQHLKYVQNFCGRINEVVVRN